ncbi:OPT oligopeptide transporter protein-domain-containing protein, partial [Phellopilus nigrolimitatus]
FDDPNLDEDAGRMEDDSPYPEVRCAVSNVDDPEMPASTVRAWFMGIMCAVIFPGLNQFMYFRWPTTAVGQLVAVLLSYPVGRLWARTIPQKKLFGISLNPGPFTIKEHVLITIMASVGGKSAYATDIVAVQRVYYEQTYSFAYQWMLVMSTQLIGFSIGGVSRRFLVSPPSMIWPANLVTCALFNTLHSQEYVGMGKRAGWSRERFFTVCLVAATAYYFFPGYLFTALSMFTWVCWIAPQNLISPLTYFAFGQAVKQMFGYSSGMGMSILTFDWAQIAYIGSPLATPWWAAANIAAGFVIFFWVLTPILYYKNVWNSQFMPIMSRMSYDNKGQIYDVDRILTPEATLDVEKYKNYSPLYLPTAFAVSYGLSFASITATIVHTILYLRKSIMVRIRGGIGERPDIHARLMASYKQVPDYWYFVIFVAMFAFGVVSIEVWPTQMPVWALTLALIIGFIYTIPIGIIQAMTNQQIAINVIAELVVGYALPGRPIAMMMFKTYAYIGVSQALRFTSDFKLGHYMKIAPRPMFWCQVVATIIAGTTNLAVQSWMFSNIPDMCSQTQKDHFICPNTEVFYTASIVWGVIGPANQFSAGQTYYPLMFFFIIGAVLPLIAYYFLKRFPNRFLQYVNIPLVLGGTNLMPPATAVNYVPWAIVGFTFQYVVRRRHFSWWAKYNYVLSAALDSSVAFGSLLIFFCLEFPRNNTIGENTIQKWWGNTVYMKTADWQSAPVLHVDEGTTFGYGISLLSFFLPHPDPSLLTSCAAPQSGRVCHAGLPCNCLRNGAASRCRAIRPHLPNRSRPRFTRRSIARFVLCHILSLHDRLTLSILGGPDMRICVFSPVVLPSLACFRRTH